MAFLDEWVVDLVEDCISIYDSVKEKFNSNKTEEKKMEEKKMEEVQLADATSARTLVRAKREVDANIRYGQFRNHILDTYQGICVLINDSIKAGELEVEVGIRYKNARTTADNKDYKKLVQEIIRTPLKEKGYKIHTSYDYSHDECFTISWREA